MKKLVFSAVSLDVGGIETALVTLLNYLAKQKENEEYKYEITLFLEKKEGIFLNEIDKRIQIKEYSPCKLKLALIRKFINLVKQTAFKLKYKEKFDFSCAYATYSKPASFVARTASKNSCLWVHSEYMKMFNNSKEEYARFFDGVKAKEFRNIVFVSENAKNIFIENFRNNKDFVNKASVIYNFIDAEEILRKSQENISDCKKEDTFTFLNVGRHYEHQKKLTRLIEASEKLKKDYYKFKVLMVGDGQDFSMYKKLITEKQLEDTIEMLGRKQNPYPYFKISDCVILTSDYEGYPVVFNEAKVLEKPIITTNVSNADTEINGKYGIVVNKNAEDIYLAMKKMLDNKSIEYKHFDYNLYNDHIMETLEKLIEND